MLAFSGSGWRDHVVSFASASGALSAKRSVAVAIGRGSTFSDTSHSTPSVPHDPASSRDTS